MTPSDEVQRLAALARISITKAELERFSKEFESIVTYISHINTLPTGGETQQRPLVRNIFREDGEPHAPGLYTERIVEQFPQRDDAYLSVKQILTHA